MDNLTNEKFEQLVDDIQILTDDINTQLKLHLEENKELKQKQSELLELVNTKTCELETVSSKNSTLTVQLESVGSHVRDLELVVVEKQRSNEMLTEKNTELQRDIESHVRNAQTLRAEIESLREQVQKLEKDAVALSSDKEKLEDEVRLLRGSGVGGDIRDVTVLRKQLQDAQQQCKNLEEQIIENTVILNNKISALDLKCKVLRSEKDTLQQELDKKNQLIDSHKRKRFFLY